MRGKRKWETGGSGINHPRSNPKTNARIITRDKHSTDLKDEAIFLDPANTIESLEPGISSGYTYDKSALEKLNVGEKEW
ncbi:MAG: hypothetical protein QXU69_09845 [Thermofilaceae archaeon]